MTDEEKNAIEQFKNFIFTYQDVIEDEYSDYEEKESAKEYQEVSEKILNLIEKQSKEIEELKQIIKENTILVKDENGDYQELNINIENHIHKDKIKAKIEFIKSLKEKFYYEENVISILQSLLEKE